MPAEIVTYLPCTPGGIALVGALYVHAGMDEAQQRQTCNDAARQIRNLAPGRIAGRLPEVGTPETLLWVCHSNELATEAISVVSTRRVIAWAWLLNETLVQELQRHMPVVHGPQNTPEAKAHLAALKPSQPDPDDTASTLCSALDHAWGLQPPPTGAL